MKISIRMKITLMVVIFTTFIVATSWVVCRVVIKNVFINNLKANMITTYKSCNRFFEDEDYPDETINDLYGKIKNPSDAIVLVLDFKSNKIYTNINNDGRMMESLYRILDSVLASNEKVKSDEAQYVINRNHDDVINSDYYDLIGTLDNGYMIIIRSPISEIDSVVHVVTNVFNYITVLLIVFCSFFVLLLSNIFSNPIKKLSHSARRMADLDFETKVPVYTKDEIGELGESMNEMSSKLEMTISQLKTANLELEKDIEDKQKLDEMRRDFLSYVSHELKTPIALIQGYAEGLKDDITDDPNELEYYYDVIIDEAKKMNSLVQKLINLNKIEYGELNINIERFELVGFINDILSSTKILADNIKANIVFEEEAPIYVWSDEFMIEEAFTNYLTNAIHYVVENGTIKVSIDKREDIVRVCVYNQGEQIPEEDLDKLFLKFYKVDKARSREYGGSGIGLSIVAATMEALGNDYGVYNVDDGVVFYFDLDNNMPC
ncbi:MAG: HAMP domain-containing protein [Lachnospiraceae bacterium]|nr:HAMP domain-containing protein [Lachnospiraceae bacterium]